MHLDSTLLAFDSSPWSARGGHGACALERVNKIRRRHSAVRAAIADLGIATSTCVSVAMQACLGSHRRTRNTWRLSHSSCLPGSVVRPCRGQNFGLAVYLEKTNKHYRAKQNPTKHIGSHFGSTLRSQRRRIHASAGAPARRRARAAVAKKDSFYAFERHRSFAKLKASPEEVDQVPRYQLHSALCLRESRLPDHIGCEGGPPPVDEPRARRPRCLRRGPSSGR